MTSALPSLPGGDAFIIGYRSNMPATTPAVSPPAATLPRAAPGRVLILPSGLASPSTARGLVPRFSAAAGFTFARGDPLLLRRFENLARRIPRGGSFPCQVFRKSRRKSLISASPHRRFLRLWRLWR
jgi:hypothetical protein